MNTNTLPKHVSKAPFATYAAASLCEASISIHGRCKLLRNACKYLALRRGLHPRIPRRPRDGTTADKCDEFPSPHGLARAKDYIGIKRISHFGSRIVPSQAGCCHVRYVPKADIQAAVGYY
jgi:hypothetical protein